MEYKHWNVTKVNKSSFDEDSIVSVELRSVGDNTVLSFKWDGCINMYSYYNGFTPDDDMTKEQKEENIDYMHICELERHIEEMQEVLTIAKDILGENEYNKNFKY